MGINFSSIEMKVIRESLYIFMFVKDVVKQSFGLILCILLPAMDLMRPYYGN